MLTNSNSGSTVFQNKSPNQGGNGNSNPLRWSFSQQGKMQQQLMQGGERPAQHIAYQKAVPYLNCLSFLLLNKGLMDLNSNYKLIKNKINLYNLPNFKQFTNTPSQVEPVLKDLSEDSHTFGQYKNRVGGFVSQDLSRYGDRIAKPIR